MHSTNVAKYQNKNFIKEKPFFEKGEYFLKGPIKMAWLYKAMGVKGCAFQVAIELWFLSGLKKTYILKFSTNQLQKANLSRFSVLRGINNLEKAGLISTKRFKGKKMIIEILKNESLTGKDTNFRNVTKESDSLCL